MQHSKKLPTLEPVRAKAELCRRSLFRFVKEFWYEVIPEDPVWNWHIEFLCDQIQEDILRVKRREDKSHDTIINIPPGTSKSTICTVMAPVWAWTIDPTFRILTASYSQSLSTDHATKSRDIIKSDKFRAMFPDIQIRYDQDNKMHYKNVKGGERYATSVGGTITGFHAHIIIVDDPINAKESASQVMLDSANNFMNTTLSTRKVNKAVTWTCLVMQRLNENDPTGNWISKKGKKIKHICLPAMLSARVSPEWVKENYVDGLLDAVRMPLSVLEEQRIDLGSYGFAGQMQQEPAPEDGEIWKRWIIPVPDHKMPAISDMTGYGTDWDTAYTKNEKNAASAYVVSGLYENKMYIDNFGEVHLEFPELIKFMKEKVPLPHYVEAKASGKSAKQTLVSQGVTALEVTVNGDKIARSRDATPRAEAGLVYCRESILESLYCDDEQGILKFPNGSKKDRADTLAQAIMRHFPNKEKRELEYGW